LGLEWCEVILVSEKHLADFAVQFAATGLGVVFALWCQSLWVNVPPWVIGIVFVVLAVALAYAVRSIRDIPDKREAK
jgi:hypothetical protein